MRSFQKLLILTFVGFCFPSNVWAARLNIPADSNGGKICKVTSMTDSQDVYGSIRRALEQGYNVQNSSLPSFCTEKIVFDTEGTITLRAPIELNNKAASKFILEKATNVRGQVVLDGSNLEKGQCAIVLDSNEVTVRGIVIRNAPGGGICIRPNSNGNMIDRVTVTRSAHGVIVMEGSQRNTIQNGSFFDNTGFGVRLQDASANRVTENAIYRNGAGAIESPATNIQPVIVSAAPTNQAASQFTLSGTIPESVDHVEVFRGAPSTGSDSNFIQSITEFTALSFLTTIEAKAGEEIFVVAIAPDGTTSPSSEVTRLSQLGSGSGGGSGPGSGPRPCFPGQVFAPTTDFDGDGIFDVNEDRNSNCQVDPGETDPKITDTDGDDIPDGIEDRNKNGVRDEGESDPTLMDTDSDDLPDGIEDRNKNGLRDFGELDPSKEDTDGDGIRDFIEDSNGNGNWDEGNETNGFRVDTDFDGVADGIEDKNHNGIVDLNESDPRKADTDGDGLLDNADPCPANDSPNCQTPCVPGVTPDETVDNDRDGIPDFREDIDSNCIVGPAETDPYNRDTDSDGRNDRVDACPNNDDLNCEGICDPDNINPFSDSDSDGVPNAQEDINGNCAVDLNESDPFDNDTDNDGTFDGSDTCPLDPNPLCNAQCRPGVPPAPEQDSDGDGIPDANEDINENCIQDASETNFRKRDTDDDGTNDNQDQCPLDADEACTNACIPGEFIAPQRDSDRDGIKDVIEDTNRNCIREVSETDSYNADTDTDGIADGIEDRNQNGLLDAGETDPRMVDTDRDGIQDGVEDRNKNGIAEFDELDPTKTDTDEDGIPDFMEDRNQNGTLDAGETNGARNDTDQDGLQDGAEDRNRNGIVDAGETDARAPDTDGDGANDGQEVTQGTNPINASQSDFNRAIGKGCSLNVGASAPDASMIGYVGMLLAGLAFRIRKKS